MRSFFHLLIIWLTIIGCALRPPDQKEIDTTISAFLKNHNIPYRKLLPHDGYLVSYTCDSIPFLKKVRGDTITIRSGYTSTKRLDNFFVDLDSNQFWKTCFVKDTVGQIELFFYGAEMVFLHRNDSLFEFVNISFSEIDTELINGLEEVFGVPQKESKKLFESQNDGRTRDTHPSGTSKMKLIFHPKMFEKAGRVKLQATYNFENDTIILEDKFKRGNKNCYSIRIINNLEGEETTYGYTFDEDMRFVYWEGCDPL